MIYCFLLTVIYLFFLICRWQTVFCLIEGSVYAQNEQTRTCCLITSDSKSVNSQYSSFITTTLKGRNKSSNLDSKMCLSSRTHFPIDGTAGQYNFGGGCLESEMQ